jgi:hypothetical protein
MKPLHSTGAEDLGFRRQPPVNVGGAEVTQLAGTEVRNDVLAQVAALLDGARGPCGCREPHPRRSSGVFVLVEDSAQAIMPMDVKMLDRGWVGDRLGQRM